MQFITALIQSSMQRMLMVFVAYTLMNCCWHDSIQGARAQSVMTVAGNGTAGYLGDGESARSARLNNVFGIARGPDGMLYVCDTDNHSIRRIDTRGRIETIAGVGSRGYTGDGGPARSAQLALPYELAWDRNGNLLVVEMGNHVVRRVDRNTGIISTVAGNGQPGFAGDSGDASNAQFNQPHSIATDLQGNIYVCDILNHRIRRIDAATSVITTWAGTGDKRTAPDGSPFLGAALHGPRALAFGRDGLAYLALREGNAIVVLDPAKNQIRHLAGTGKQGFTGNGGPAIEATLSGPKGIALDRDGNVWIADTESHTIRRIDQRTGTIDVMVGDGQRGNGPDGDAPRSCRLARPHSVWVDVDGAVLIGDSENHRVRRWLPDTPAK